MWKIKLIKKLSKRYLILIVAIILLMGSVMFFQFTSLGYRMTVPYRDFTELKNNVYVANDYTGDRGELISIIDESTKRISNFWGKLESTPIIMICDNKEILRKLGGDHDTATFIFLNAYCYISISSQYLNVDIMSHEMTHAELHTRIYNGKIAQKLIPIWFDEGVATQNDYRLKYNDDAWEEATNNGKVIIDLSEIDTTSEFYSGEVSDRVYRYIVSRHEVKEWIKRNGIDGLVELISRINKGGNFYELYKSR